MQLIKICKKVRRFSYMLYLLLFFIPIKAEAQVNYVLNPSFEQYSRCPYEYDDIKFAVGWQPIDTIDYPAQLDTFGSPNCTPEYCNECAGANSYAGIPSAGFYNHYARTGKGMASMMMYNDLGLPSDYAIQRNYLQGRLTGPLITGRSYCVSFYVCIEFHAQYAIDHIGAYLDNGIIDTTQNCGYPQTTHIPQVYTHNVISDSIHWTKIEGSFVANGTEKYITIGNFFDTAHTKAIFVKFSDGVSFYLVDDVSVVESDIPAYAGGWMYKTKKDSVFIGRNEIVPDCMWYRNGVLIDTVRAGFWVKDTVNTMYVVKQSICGNVKYDTAWVNIASEGVSSVGSESVFRIYPNPASKEIMIQAPNNTSTVSMVVHDMNGRVMMKRDIAFVNGAYRLLIELNSGMYMVELVGEDGFRSVQRLSVL